MCSRLDLTLFVRFPDIFSSSSVQPLWRLFFSFFTFSSWDGCWLFIFCFSCFMDNKHITFSLKIVFLLSRSSPGRNDLTAIQYIESIVAIAKHCTKKRSHRQLDWSKSWSVASNKLHIKRWYVREAVRQRLRRFYWHSNAKMRIKWISFLIRIVSHSLITGRLCRFSLNDETWKAKSFDLILNDWGFCNGFVIIFFFFSFLFFSFRCSLWAKMNWCRRF